MARVLPSLSAVALVPCLAALALHGHAADGDAPAATTVDQRLQALEQQVRDLTRADTAKSTAVVTAGQDGFAIAAIDGSFKLRVGGYAQMDGRFWFNDDKVRQSDTFIVRRARVTVEGTLGRIFDFRVQPDFGGGATVLADAFIIANLMPEFHIEVGRFKEPVGLEWLQNDPVTFFIERGLPSSLVPQRDEGIQVFGDLWGGRTSYNVGVFNGSSDNANRDTDSGDDKDVVARLMFSPFKDTAVAPLAGLTFGAGGSVGYDDGTVAITNLPAFKTAGQATYFNYVAPAVGGTLANTAVARGVHFRFSPQAYYAWGPFSALGEYVLSKQRIQLGGLSDEIGNQAGQVAVGYVLTGERASFKGVTPASPFGLNGGGWGALEVVARAEKLIVDQRAFDDGFAIPTASARSAAAVGVGLNWYLTKNLKVQLDYEHTIFTGGATAATGGNRESENLVATRFQVVF